MSEITITLVSWYSCEYIERLISNLSRKAAHPDSLRFLIIDNTNGTDKSLEKLNMLNLCIEIIPFSPGNLRGSRAHAAGLNYAMKQLNTPYGLVADPDIYVFKKHWESFLINVLQSRNAIAVGAPFPAWKTGKYHDFPSPPFCFFDARALRELCMDWTPFSRTTVGFIWKFFVRQVGRIGLVASRHRYQKYKGLRRYSHWAEKTLGVFAPDTGWKIACAAKERGAKPIVFDAVMPDNPILETQTATETLIELARHYELFFFEQQPFVVHQYGSQGILWKTKRGEDDTHWRECIDSIETKQAKELKP